MHRRLNRGAALAILLVITVVLLAIDLATKLAVRGGLVLGEAQPLIPGLIEIRLAFNGGAAFGLFDGGGLLFVVIAVVVVLGILANTVVRPKHAGLEIVSQALLMAGALGNAVDRLGDGQVTDFFNLLFIDFAIFNVADACLTCGVILFVLWILLDSLKDKRSVKFGSAKPSAASSKLPDAKALTPATPAAKAAGSGAARRYPPRD